ncbi:hypothetical protein JCM10213_008287, partial [Rhodosporidiobolus nylandii]
MQDAKHDQRVCLEALSTAELLLRLSLAVEEQDVLYVVLLLRRLKEGGVSDAVEQI